MSHKALGHQVARRGGDIRFVKCSRMLADLAGGHADRTIGQRMREYTRPLCIVRVDDFAMREHTPTQSDDLYDLVSDRAIAAKPLILTSNRAPKDWYPLFPNPQSVHHHFDHPGRVGSACAIPLVVLAASRRDSRADRARCGRRRRQHRDCGRGGCARGHRP